MGGNLALRFLVELATYAALGYWGASVSAPFAARAALAVAVPAAAIVLWTQLLAPKAAHHLREPGALLVEVAIFAGGAAALAAAGSAALGAALGGLSVANAVLVRLGNRTQPAEPRVGARW